jgi:hypothetical protein
MPKTPSEVEHYISVFRQLSGDIMKNIPDVMLATMSILSSEYLRIKYVQGTLVFHKLELFSFSQALFNL